LVPPPPDGVDGLPDGDFGAVLGVGFFSGVVPPLAAPLLLD
jgi:hypothetical protein